MEPTWQTDDGAVRLYLADCLDVLPTLSGVDAVVTDPPYGINTKSDGSGKLSPWGDLVNSALWYREWIGSCKKVLKRSGALWTCLNWRSLVTFQKASCDLRWPIESLMVWDKRWIGPGGCKGLRPSYELVALLCREEFSIEDRGLADVQPFPWSSQKPNGHPAEKPEELMAFCAENSTSAGGLIVDPFLGSGTSGVAAVRSGMRFVGIEQDEEWFSRAQRRIQEALGMEVKGKDGLTQKRMFAEPSSAP